MLLQPLLFLLLATESLICAWLTDVWSVLAYAVELIPVLYLAAVNTVTVRA